MIIAGFVAKNICALKKQKRFIATNIILSRQAYFCGDNRRVATKLILVAAPANDSVTSQKLLFFFFFFFSFSFSSFCR